MFHGPRKSTLRISKFPESLGTRAWPSSEKGFASVVSMVGTVSAESPSAIVGGRATLRAREGSPGLGSDTRMRELYHAHAHALRRFLLGVTFGEQQTAEDLLQETFLRAWRNLDQLAPDVASLRPWLFTVARRIAIDVARA